MPIGVRGFGGPVKLAPEPLDVFTPPTPPIEIIGLQGVSPTMLSSMPLLASGADVYMRQFYRGSRLPFRRYLPVRSQ